MGGERGGEGEGEAGAASWLRESEEGARGKKNDAFGRHRMSTNESRNERWRRSLLFRCPTKVSKLETQRIEFSDAK